MFTSSTRPERISVPHDDDGHGVPCYLRQRAGRCVIWAGSDQLRCFVHHARHALDAHLEVSEPAHRYHLDGATRCMHGKQASVMFISLELHFCRRSSHAGKVQAEHQTNPLTRKLFPFTSRGTKTTMSLKAGKLEHPPAWHLIRRHAVSGGECRRALQHGRKSHDRQRLSAMNH